MKILERKVLSLEFLKKSEVKKLMADRFYGYQYDTSPRKLNSQYTSYRNRYPQENEPVETTNNNYKKNITTNNNRKKATGTDKQISKRKNIEYGRNKNIEQEKQVSDNSKKQVIDKNNKLNKVNVKAKLKIVMFLVAGFSVLFAISYQNSLISESFNKKEQYKKEMEALRKTNQQIEISIENNLNLNNIERVAKEKIGMQKLNNNQKIYVDLPKQDYVAPASEQIVMEENQSFFQKLFSVFSK